MIDITFVALLAFGLVVQLGLSIAVILGILAFNFGSMLAQIARELLALAVAHEMFPLGRALHRPSLLAGRPSPRGTLGEYARSRMPLSRTAPDLPRT